jgi:hypothetical protein
MPAAPVNASAFIDTIGRGRSAAHIMPVQMLRFKGAGHAPG